MYPDYERSSDRDLEAHGNFSNRFFDIIRCTNTLESALALEDREVGRWHALEEALLLPFDVCSILSGVWHGRDIHDL